MECSDWKTTSLCWMGTRGRNTPVETFPSSVSLPTVWVVICSVVEFTISATSGQDLCAAAIAEKSTGCASAMEAKMGHSGATRPSSGQSSAVRARPSSGQSSAVRAGEVGWADGGCCMAAVGRRLMASATTFSWPENSAMKESCRCWRADQGCDQWLVVSEEAKLSPLQQESEMSDRPDAASSSLSKVECLVPAPTDSWSRTPAAASSPR
jgi:hypothetical protein